MKVQVYLRKRSQKNESLWTYFCRDKNMFNDGKLEQITSRNPLEFKNDRIMNSPIYLFVENFNIVREKRMKQQNKRFRGLIN